MDFLSDYSRFENLLERDNTWKSLRAKSVPFIISFLKNIFAEEREVEYEVARANLKEFLEELKTKLDPDEQRRSAKDHLNEWMNRRWIRELNNRITMTDATFECLLAHPERNRSEQEKLDRDPDGRKIREAPAL